MPQGDLGEILGDARHQLAAQFSAVDAAVAHVARARDNVAARVALQADELRDELRVVRHVGVENDDVIALGVRCAVQVGGSKRELALARREHELFGAESESRRPQETWCVPSGEESSMTTIS